MNIIYLRRRSKIILPEGTGVVPVEYLATLQVNLESLGFIFAPEILAKMRTMNPLKLDQFYTRLVKDLRASVGDHQEFTPFYPDFPAQVMEMSEAELYINAIIHYFTLGRPQFPESNRPALQDTPPLRVIHLGTRADFESMLTLMIASKSPLSPTDQADVTWFATQYRETIGRLMPAQIPNKENLAFFGAQLLRETTLGATVLDRHIKTPTDVLRLAVALSEGDVSLAVASKFGKFSRPLRALLLGWLERCQNLADEMVRHQSRWVRLGERLHPGEYSNRFPITAAAFDIIRNHRPAETFNSKVELALVQRDLPELLSILKSRPGELARRLDHLLRISPNSSAIISAFADEAAEVSTPVLLQVMTHFANRSQPANLRVFFPKGELANLYASDTPLPALDLAVIAEIHSICEETLTERFSTLAPLGSCYLDPQLKNYLVPFSQRSAAKSLRTLVRGSRLPLPAGNTLRFFVWWKNGIGRVDLDLSAAMFASDFGYIDTLAYYNLKNFGAHHSGDIVDAPKGAAEFIDVDIHLCLEAKVRYVVMNVTSFTQQPYCDLPECFAGWMSRMEANSGEIFEPKTVVDKVDIAAKTKFCMAAIFDLVERQVIWADMALATHPVFSNNVANHLRGVSLMLRSIVQLQKTNLHTLFGLHIQARGHMVDDIAMAQTVFSVEQGITPFDLDIIGANFM